MANRKAYERIYSTGYGHYRKYKASPEVVDGIKFPSKLEAERYRQLRLLERAGVIFQLRVHPRYIIAEAARDPHTGEKINKRYYEGDFEYMDEYGQLICEDTKGVETDVFSLKWDLVRPLFPNIEFRILKDKEVYG